MPKRLHMKALLFCPPPLTIPYFSVSPPHFLYLTANLSLEHLTNRIVFGIVYHRDTKHSLERLTAEWIGFHGLHGPEQQRVENTFSSFLLHKEAAMMTSTNLAMFSQLFVHACFVPFYEYPQCCVHAGDDERRRSKDSR
jgi:hypothetical protein